jgi:DNA-binding SARP family transcriptional activator
MRSKGLLDASQPVEIRLLGPLEVGLDGVLRRIGGPKRRALLARLALDPGAVVPADLLLHDLWAGRPPPGAIATLRSHVAHLRRDLGPAGSAIATVSPGYSLEVDEEAVDTVAFERAVQAARSAADPDAVLLHTDTALRLWRGRALVEFEPWTWADDARRRLDELRIEAEERHAAALLAQGSHSVAVARLEALTAAHPLHERFWLHLIEALWGCARHAEAVRAAQRFRSQLGEIGMSASPELERLEGAILRHAPQPNEPAPLRRHPRPATWGPAPSFSFVGRDRERLTLESELERTEREGQRIVLLSGEVGIGKTRLVRSMVELATGRRGFALEGHCDDTLAIPFQPVVEALSSFVAYVNEHGMEADAAFGEHPEDLARLIPDLRTVVPDMLPVPSVDPELAQYRFFRAADDWLSAVSRDQPVVLVIEDIHWASRPTLFLIRHIMRSSARRSLLVLATYRDPEPWRAPGAAGWLADVKRMPNATHIQLAGLDHEAVETLVREAQRSQSPPARDEPDVVAREVHRLTRGNPLLVVELLRQMPTATSLARLGVPMSVHLLVRDRIERLDDDATHTLQRAAVLGMDVDLLVLRASSDLDDEDLALALDTLVGTHFLEPTGGSVFTYRFPHALVRDAVLHDLSDLRLALLHRAAGFAVEARHAGDVEQYLDRLAAHFRVAAPLEGPSKAIQYGIRAGHRALAEGAADESLAHFEAVLALMDELQLGDDPARCEALLGTGEAQRRLERSQHRRTFLDAARLARDLGDVDRLARAAKGISRGFLLMTEASDAARIDLISSALEALGDGPSHQRALLLGSLAGELRFAGDMDRSHVLADEAVHAARQTGSDDTLIRVLATRWDILFHPRSLAERTRISAELAGIADRCPDPALRLRVALVELTGALERADREAARRAMTAIQQIADDRLPPASGWMVPLAGATWALARGRLDQAETLAKHAREQGSAHGDNVAEIVFVGQLFQIRLHQGRLAEIDGELRLVADQLPGARAAYAYLCCEAGRKDDAASEVGILMGGGPESLARDASWPLAVALLSETVVRLGDARRAAALESELAPTPDQHLAHFGYYLGPVAYYLGILRGAQSDRRGAKVWLARAEHSARAFGATTYQERARQHRAVIERAR